MSKYAFYCMILQSSLYSFAFSHISEAQNKKLSEIDLKLNLEGVSLSESFHRIENETEFTFAYLLDELPASQITIRSGKKSLEEVLILISDQSGVSFRRVNETIHVRKALPSETPIVDLSVEVALRKVDGRVTDESGQGLPGATVLEKGTSNGTITDVDGNFSLQVNDGAVLFISFVGYESQELTVNDQTNIHVMMKPDFKSLEEVVVIGYGSVKKSDLTGSVVSIDAKNLTNVPVTNTLETLQGRVSGLDITRSSGQAGAGLNFTIRGNRSLNAANTPLILVDGIQYGTYIDINPNDIASVEVLKDASSTAIYGSRGANGVIIITTKDGSKGKTKIELNNYYGINTLTDYRKFANTDQYVAMTREAYRAAGQWASEADDATIFGANYANIQKGVNTDWPSLMLHNGAIQSHHLAISGGNDKTSFRLSSEYFREEGLMNNDQLKRFVQRINFDHEISKNLKTGITLNFNASNQDARNTSFWNLIKLLPTGEPYNEDGSIKEFPFPGNLNLNPLFDENKTNYYNNTKSNTVFLVGYADWELMKNLNLRSNLGYTLSNRQQGIFEGTKSTWSTNNNGFSKSSLTDTNNKNLTWENTLSYKYEQNVHSFDAMVGNSILTYRTTSLSGEGRNQPFESALFYNLNTNTDNVRTFSDLSESQLASFFGRVNYKLLDRYLVTFTMRGDGASVLAEGKKWAYFPSAAFAWRMKEETFLSGVNWLSDLKARLSYGVSGNSAISPYQTQGGVSKINFSFNDEPAFGYLPTTIANKDLGWETTSTRNFGLDFGLFKDRITGTVDVYHTKTDDLLMQSILPSLTGYTSIIANIGKTQTNGIDLLLSTTNINTRNFTWSTDFNFSKVKEEIVELSAGGDDVSNAWFVGKPINVIYDYEKIGIWQTAETDEAATYSRLPGSIKVKDQNNDGVISAADDRKVLGQKSPKWTAGMNQNFTYKNLTLSVLLYARVGQMIDCEFRKMYYTGGIQNTPYVDYWTPENQTNDYPRPILGNDSYISTLGYVDGSFFKVKDIRLSYVLPKQALDFLHVSRVTVYGTAKNYLTVTNSKLKDYDPERGGSATYPLTKQLVFGLNIQL